MLELAEPIRIITKSHALSIAGAALLLAVLHDHGKRCSVRAVQNYTRAELDALLHEDYPSFVLIDCAEAGYREKIKNAHFISSGEIYPAVQPLNAQQYAHILVAGYYAEHIELGRKLDIPDPVLQDALQSGTFAVPGAYAEITSPFLESLTFLGGGVLKKMVDFAAVINACAHTGRAACAISALLTDVRAQEEAIRVMAEYRHDIAHALEWCRKNEKYTASGISIVHMKDYVAWYLTGSVAQHLAADYALVLVLAYAPDGWIRVSLRGRKKGANLLKLLCKIFEGLEGECGGGEPAAGGMFLRKDEEKFLSAARNILENAYAEEEV
ncbi:hypothetical protein HY497_00575 [Candidatus Woesearchaeota archaeon]|nr:hypothetical protein [Candidatus Woesearchaeota archaeon]